jgi:hypothetical protein
MAPEKNPSAKKPFLHFLPLQKGGIPLFEKEGLGEILE